MASFGSVLIVSVEYAIEAISHAGTVLAVLSKEGIALAAEKVRHIPLAGTCCDTAWT